MAVKPIPDGYHTVTPYLICKDAARAIDFYKSAFGATELLRMDGPGGTVAHAEIKVGNSPIMLSEGCPQMGFRDPHALGGTPVSICLYVEDSDAVTETAIAAGATVLRPITDQFYGDRSATLTDPFGHVWTVATHKEDVTPEECARRAQEWMAKHMPEAVAAV